MVSELLYERIVRQTALTMRLSIARESDELTQKDLALFNSGVVSGSLTDYVSVRGATICHS